MEAALATLEGDAEKELKIKSSRSQMAQANRS